MELMGGKLVETYEYSHAILDHDYLLGYSPASMKTDVALCAATAVPLLLTVDVHKHPNLESVLLRSAELFLNAGQKVTYFVVAELVQHAPGVARCLLAIRNMGHGIGCHGLEHELDPATLSRDTLTSHLQMATRILEDATSAPVRCYRAPDFRLSKNTLPILEALGYTADCSVCPRRLPILSSCPGCYGWLFAPPSPYHPSADSPFRRGNLRLLEIPVSCFVIPMAHGSVSNLSSTFLKAFTNSLVAEARMIRTRVVQPALHPESFLGEEVYDWLEGFGIQDFVPKRFGGFRLRHQAIERDPLKVKERVEAFAASLSAIPGLVPMTIDQYVASYDLWPNASALTSQPATRTLK